MGIISRPLVVHNYKLKIDSDQSLNVNIDEIAGYLGCQINWPSSTQIAPISGVSCRIFTLLIFSRPELARGRLRGGQSSRSEPCNIHDMSYEKMFYWRMRRRRDDRMVETSVNLKCYV